MPLIVVMLMAQFATQAVQPVVTLFVQEMLGDRPDLATLGGLAFSVTGMAGVLAVPFLGRKSDVIGYRTVLLICLLRRCAVYRAAGGSAGLLAVRGGALRIGPVRWRHPAGGQFADRPSDHSHKPRLRIRHGLVSLFRRQHAGAADRGHDRRHHRHSFRIRRDRGFVADQSGLGLVHRSRGTGRSPNAAGSTASRAPPASLRRRFPRSADARPACRASAASGAPRHCAAEARGRSRHRHRWKRSRSFSTVMSNGVVVVPSSL